MVAPRPDSSDGPDATGAAPDAMHEIEQVETRVVYEDRWTRLRADRTRRRDGTAGTYSILERPDFAIVVPFSGTQFWLVEQYRYPVRGRYWELPQGTTAGATDLLAVAAAELREETGLAATEFRAIGRLFNAYGMSQQAFDVVLATGLIEGGAQELEPSEADLITAPFDRQSVEAMISDGRIRDSNTIAAFAMFDRYVATGAALG